MPELPDVEVFASNINKIFSGKKLVKIKVINGNKLKDTAKELSTKLDGKTLKKIYRSGKEMRFEFSGDVLLGLHLMLTGDLFVFEKNNEHKFTIVEMHFNNGQGLALTDRMRNANIKLTPVDKKGVDAVSVQLNFKYLKQAFQKKTNIKNILLDQDIIRGIGNSYSDEILWQTKISPYSVAEAIPDDKIRELAFTIKKVLKDEIKRIDKTHPGITWGEVKEFLQIHTRAHDKSPTGAPIIIDKKGARKTYYTKEQKLYK